MGVIFFIIGCFLGSFYNVVALRGIKKESIIYPNSHCVICNHELGVKDLIPIISFLTLKGKCRYCGGQISKIYPIGEFFTGLSYMLLYIKFGISVDLIIQIILITMLIINSLIDIKVMEINVFTVYLASLLNLMLRVIFDVGNSLYYVLSGLGMFFLLFLLYKVFEGKMGGGDVKVYGAIGFSVGIVQSLTSIFYASIFAIIYFIIKVRDREKPIPFVPFIYLGVMVSYFIKWGV